MSTPKQYNGMGKSPFAAADPDMDSAGTLMAAVISIAATTTTRRETVREEQRYSISRLPTRCILAGSGE
jgi:hypothetical protein